jgi:hypothetical protein
MPPDQIQKLAQEIVTRGIQTSLAYWLLVASLLLIATFLGSYLSKYAGRRAEHKADEADLKAILKNVEQTTRLAEGIKSVVSLGEWTERERRSLKRQKLEELLLKAYFIYDWLGTARLRLLSLDAGDFQATWWELNTVATLGALYFPDLQEPVGRFADGCNNYYKTIWSIHADLLNIPHGKLEARLEAKYKRSSELDETSAEVRESLSALTQRASAVMKGLIEISQTTFGPS